MLRCCGCKETTWLLLLLPLLPYVLSLPNCVLLSLLLHCYYYYQQRVLAAPSVVGRISCTWYEYEAIAADNAVAQSHVDNPTGLLA